MADRIYIDNGRASIMCVGAEPWHGLGITLDKPATAAQAIMAANLDWTVKKVPLYAWGDGIAYPMKDTFTVVPEHRWGQENCPTYGIVAATYTPLQNRDAFEFFDLIVGEGAAIYHTAGALDDGRRVWVLAKLPSDITVAGKDIAKKYLLLSNCHDGSGSVQIKFTPVRVVCHNTLTMALEQGDRAIRVSHTRNIKERMADARLNLQLINTTYSQIERTFNGMAKVRMDETRLDKYVGLVFPEPKKRDARDIERVEKDRARACTLFTKGMGNQVPGVASTLWAAYNAVTEMVDHGRNRRTEGQHLEYIWFGGGSALKVRAFDHAKTLMTEWMA
jgi:phage/plasmid-like protein (TIGR03299 family)